MRRGLPALAALAALLALALGGAASATAQTMDTMLSELTIAFKEQVVFTAVEGAGMDINFGMQPIPDGEALIPAEDGDHTLSITDWRQGVGGWSANAQISPFTSDRGSFMGTLHLYLPTLYRSASNSLLLPNLVSGTQLVYIQIGPEADEVAVAVTPDEPSEYSLTFTEENTRLFISAAEAAKIKGGAYRATITWTLSLEP